MLIINFYKFVRLREWAAKQEERDAEREKRKQEKRKKRQNEPQGIFHSCFTQFIFQVQQKSVKLWSNYN